MFNQHRSIYNVQSIRICRIRNDSIEPNQLPCSSRDCGRRVGSNHDCSWQFTWLQVRVLLRSGESRAVRRPRHDSVAFPMKSTVFGTIETRDRAIQDTLRRISSSLLLATWQWTDPTEPIATKSVDHVELTPWRNWIAHWTSNPEVAGSNPVGVGSRHFSKMARYLNR